MVLRAIPPMPLGYEDSSSSVESATIVGFGMTGHATRDYPIKREGSITIADCDSADTEEFICFDFNNAVQIHANCARDSGGPMIREVNGQYLLIGIASRADANCDAGEALYVNVTDDDRRDWIESFINSPVSFDFVLNTVTIQGTLAAGGISEHTYPVAIGAEYLTATVNFPLKTSSTGPIIMSDFQLRLSNNGVAELCDNSYPEFGVCAKNSPQAGSWIGRLDANTGYNIFQLTMTQMKVN